MAARMQEGDARSRELAAYQKEVAENAKGAHSIHVSDQMAAIHAGSEAAANFFKQFDTDADGTLSARELRQALNKVRKRNPDMPGMDEMLAALDGDGDGILTLPEFIEKMPKALTQAIKSLGPMTLVNGAASMGSDTHRERERKVAADVQAAKQASRGAHDVALHTAALKAGQKVSVVDLFQKFDADNSGSIGKGELRKMLVLIRKKCGEIEGVDQMQAKMDADSDGDISLDEWLANIPPALSKAVLNLEPEDMNFGSTQKTNSSAAQFGREDKRGQDMAKFNAELSKQKETSKLQDVGAHLAAARTGDVAHEILLFQYFDVDHSGSLGMSELRKMLAMVRVALSADAKKTKKTTGGDGASLASMDELLVALDKDGDKTVTLDEWQQHLPEDLTKAIRRVGRAGLLEYEVSFKSRGGRIAKAGGGGFSKSDTSKKDKAAADRHKARKAQSSQAHSVREYAKAARGGGLSLQSFFAHFDNDNSGTLSPRELRRALGLIRTKAMQQPGATESDIPGLEDMMKTLDEDNDGDVTFSEWEKKIPAELKAVLNKLGPKLLEQGSGGVGKRGGARMQVSEREKELRRFEAEMAAKKAAQRKDGVVGERTAAAHTGRRGLSSIFEELDHDNSGSLTVRELRHAFAALGMSPEERHSIQAVLADMDTDGNGEIGLEEFDAKLPLYLKKALQSGHSRKQTVSDMAGQWRKPSLPTGSHRLANVRGALGHQYLHTSSRSDKQPEAVLCPWRATGDWAKVLAAEQTERRALLNRADPLGLNRGSPYSSRRMPYYGAIRLPAAIADPGRMRATARLEESRKSYSFSPRSPAGSSRAVPGGPASPRRPWSVPRQTPGSLTARRPGTAPDGAGRPARGGRSSSPRGVSRVSKYIQSAHSNRSGSRSYAAYAVSPNLQF